MPGARGVGPVPSPSRIAVPSFVGVISGEPAPTVLRSASAACSTLLPRALYACVRSVIERDNRASKVSQSLSERLPPPPPRSLEAVIEESADEKRGRKKKVEREEGGRLE